MTVIEANLSQLQSELGYNFSNISLLNEALSHPSLRQVRKDQNDYERLEFLGDAVLNLLISEEIYKSFTDYDEGQLAKIRAFLVCKDSICKVSERLKLENLIIMTRGEELSGGRTNLNNVENAMEAIIAAIYLDGGLEAVRSVVLKLWAQLLEIGGEVKLDPKSALQEWAQSLSMSIPAYSLVSKVGESHMPMFKVMVTIDHLEAEYGEGKSIKMAEKEAASKFLKRVGRS